MSQSTFDQLMGEAETQLWSGFRQAEAKFHKGIRGASREEALTSFLASRLPARFGVTTGLAVDADDRRSGQLDVVIYDRNLTAPLLKEKSGDLLPAERLLAVIEVKSVLNKQALKQAAKAAKSISLLRPYGAEFVASRKDG